MEQPVIIRGGTAEDLAAVAELQAASPAAMDWPVHDYLTYQLDVAEVAGEVVGFLVTRRLVEGEAEVLNLAVRASERRKGIGRELLRRALERWPGTWFLEVRASNFGAQSCYESLGFRQVGLRPGYYGTEDGNSAEEGIVMEKGK